MGRYSVGEYPVSNAWASHKSFSKMDGGEPPDDGARPPDADFKGEKHSNATH